MHISTGLFPQENFIFLRNIMIPHFTVEKIEVEGHEETTFLVG